MRIKSDKKNSRRALTFMEMLIVVSLFSMISIVVYRSFAQGITVWRKSNEIVLEQDIAIFFDKIASDLQNAYHYSLISVEGMSSRFAFPSVVRVLADSKSSLSSEETIFQMGKVEYFFDRLEKKLYRRQANYAQALKNVYQDPQVVVPFLNEISFKYFYAKNSEEFPRDQTLGMLPSAIEIEVQFKDQYGQRSLK
ncbi:MAG TPA: hypothetical protein PKH98_06095, partial [Candidatus Omnitrophota bacterium]|nr:hypothetical protein [Candidatus Omnitrophota bacterium]